MMSIVTKEQALEMEESDFPIIQKLKHNQLTQITTVLTLEHNVIESNFKYLE